MTPFSKRAEQHTKVPSLNSAIAESLQLTELNNNLFLQSKREI